MAPSALSMDARIQSYRSLVRKVALSLLHTLPPCVTLDELEASGLVGLWQALQRYNPALGVPFMPYACRRIRGEMVDELRRMRWKGTVVVLEMEQREPSYEMAELECFPAFLIAREIAALCSSWQEVVNGFYADQPASKLAVKRGVTSGTISVQKKRAFVAMRHSLESRGVTFADCL